MMIGKSPTRYSTYDFTPSTAISKNARTFFYILKLKKRQPSDRQLLNNLGKQKTIQRMCFFHLLKKKQDKDESKYKFYESEKQSESNSKPKKKSEALLIGSGTFDENFHSNENENDKKIPDEFFEDRQSEPEDYFYFYLSIVAILVPIFLMWALVFPALVLYSNWFWLTIIFSVYLIALSIVSLCLTRHSNPGIIPKRNFGSLEDQQIFRQYQLSIMKTKYTRDHLAPEKTIT